MATQSEKQLVTIHTDYFTVIIKGSASHPVCPGIEIGEKESELRVTSAGTFAEEFDVEFAENAVYELVGRDDGLRVYKETHLLHGNLNFGNEIGMSDLVFLVNGKKYLTLTIEVFPSKISYKEEDYQAIVEDVTREVYNLIFDLLKRTYQSFQIDPSKKISSQAEFFAVIRVIYDQFKRAADMILAKPHHILEKEHVVLPGHKVKRTDNQSLRWIEKHPSVTKRDGDRVLVDRALAVKKHVTYNTRENQLAKYILQTTAKRLMDFKRDYENLARENDPEVLKEVSCMIKGMKRRYNSGFMREVDAMPARGSMSLVFAMAPGYRELYKYYLMCKCQANFYIRGGKIILPRTKMGPVNIYKNNYREVFHAIQ